MDATAIAHARENNIPILVFSVQETGALIDVVQSRGNFTLIEDGG
jgi:uridylate kinase